MRPALINTTEPIAVRVTATCTRREREVVLPVVRGADTSAGESLTVRVRVQVPSFVFSWASTRRTRRLARQARKAQAGASGPIRACSAPWTALTPQERREIAEHMTARWRAWVMTGHPAPIAAKTRANNE